MKRTCLSALLLLLILYLPACRTVPDITARDTAVLHEADDRGFIEVSAIPTDFATVSPQVFVYGESTGEFLYLTGEEHILYPASTAKLLTALYALTLISPETEITPGDELELVAADASIAYIKPHHRLTAEMLIEGMLLPSGNDAAYALAAAAGKAMPGNAGLTGKDAVAAFVQGMNRYAQDLGMCGSYFTTPDGYHDGKQYSTLEDMAVLARTAADNELIRKYAALPEDNVIYASGHMNTWVNTNLLLHKDSAFYSPCVVGLKTGSAGDGNFSLLCVVQYEEERYIVGIFSAPDADTRFTDALQIIKELCPG